MKDLHSCKIIKYAFIYSFWSFEFHLLFTWRIFQLHVELNLPRVLGVPNKLMQNNCGVPLGMLIVKKYKSEDIPVFN
jgi:hypothetical protein